MKEKTDKLREKNVRRIVIKELPHFWLYSVLSVIMSLVIELVGLIPPILMQRIIDIAIPSKNIRSILIAIVWFCAIPLISTILTTFYRYILAISCRKFGQRLSIKGFQNLIYQPISYFDYTNSSELATYCRSEALNYVIFWVIDIPQLLSTMLIGILVLGYVVSLNWLIGLFLLLYIPFSFFPSNHFAVKVKDFSKRIIQNNAAMNQIVNDTFKGIKFVKSMALEKVQIKKLEEVNADSVSIWSKVAVYDNLSGLWTDNFSDTIFTGLTFGVASILVATDHMSLGMLVIILNYTAKFLKAAKQLTHTNYHFKSQLGAYEKLFDILLMKPAESNGTETFQFQNSICFRDVCFSYEEERGDILKGLQLNINQGEWLGIMGHSGAGKTTIFDLLLQFYQPRSGNIFVDGKDLQAFDCQDLRQKITKVSQDTFLFPGTIRENLCIVNPAATEDDLWSALNSVCLKEFVQQLACGLDTVIGENGLLLSGGERQRLGLAQGLLRKSEVILLDEVTANIDAEAEATIMDILAELKKERHLTILSISHRLDFLSCTDRIVILEDGKVQEKMKYTDLKNKRI